MVYSVQVRGVVENKATEMSKISRTKGLHSTFRCSPFILRVRGKHRSWSRGILWAPFLILEGLFKVDSLSIIGLIIIFIILMRIKDNNVFHHHRSIPFQPYPMYGIVTSSKCLALISSQSTNYFLGMWWRVISWEKNLCIQDIYWDEIRCTLFTAQSHIRMSLIMWASKCYLLLSKIKTEKPWDWNGKNKTNQKNLTWFQSSIIKM